MKTIHTNNGVSLEVESSKNTWVSRLNTSTREILISKGAVTGLYTASITKIAKCNLTGSTETTNIRTYTGLSQGEALAWFDKKQHQLGFFAK